MLLVRSLFSGCFKLVASNRKALWCRVRCSWVVACRALIRHSLFSGTSDAFSVSSSVSCGFSSVTFCLSIARLFLRPLLRFIFTSGVICHSWRWELCVHRSEDRGSTGSPLDGFPQQVSRLVLLDGFSERFCEYLHPCIFGCLCSRVCFVGV